MSFLFSVRFCEPEMMNNHFHNAIHAQANENQSAVSSILFST